LFKAFNQALSFIHSFMGHPAGRASSIRFNGSSQDGGTFFRLRAGLLALLFLQSCVVAPLSKKSATKPWQRSENEAPHLLARLFYGDAETTQAMLVELGDVARPVRRWSRQGNGAVSVRCDDERGKPLPMVECGGCLIMEGNPGQAYALRVRNETDVILEVLPMVDGLDLESGLEASLERPGRQVAPRKETVFNARVGPKGKAECLRFLENRGTATVHRSHVTGTAGSLVIAVFLGEGDESFDSRSARERRRPGIFPQPGSFPERRYEAMLLPYQYR